MREGGREKETKKEEGINRMARGREKSKHQLRK